MADTKPSVPRLDYSPRVSREKEVFGDSIEYFDFNNSLWHRSKSAFLRAIQPINPFAIPHDSNDDHVGRRSLSKAGVTETESTSLCLSLIRTASPFQTSSQSTLTQLLRSIKKETSTLFLAQCLLRFNMTI